MLIGEQGQLCTSEKEIQDEIEGFYAQLFTTSNPSHWQAVVVDIPSMISNSMNLRLIRPVDDFEVKKALFSMHPDKAPGPDGMTPKFFQKCWLKD